MSLRPTAWSRLEVAAANRFAHNGGMYATRCNLIFFVVSLLITCAFCALSALAAEPDTFPVRIAVDAAAPIGDVRPVWRFFGADEPNYATMKDGRKLLTELGELKPKEVFFRTHNLLNTGDGTPALKWGSTNAYNEDAAGNPIYDWTIVDNIFATYLERGVRPYVQIGFMPEALSRRPDPYQHKWFPALRYEKIFTGWAHPPTDFARWQTLVHEWAKHCIDRFGKDEVEQWYWEVWNEPNIGYWQGTPAEFHELHDHAIAAVRSALPTAKVGGPDVAGSGGQFMRDFLDHCLHGKNYATGEIGTPLDFVAFHAKGQPQSVDGHVRMGIREHLRTIDEGFGIIKSFPELKVTPIVIGESDPEGCAACQGPQLAYRNSTMYSSYTAASFARKQELADRHAANLEGVLTWAFEFEDQPLFAGFRALATGGLDLPVLNVFRMFARMSGQRLTVESDAAIPLDDILKSGIRDRPDVSAIASLDKSKLCILAWHYHDDDLPGPAAEIALTIDHLPANFKSPTTKQFQIDADHSNAYTAWQGLGSPQNPTADEYKTLEQKSQLTEINPPEIVAHQGGSLNMKLTLPRQAVTLLMIEPAP